MSAAYQVKDQWHPTTAMDLSRLGCRLRLGEALARGTPVNVRLECLEKGTPETEPRRVEIAGKVVWSRLEGLSYQCGIHFVSESDEVELLLHPQE